MSQHRREFVKSLLLLFFSTFCCFSFSAPYTPSPGNPERVAICDALRVYVVEQHAHAKPRKKIVFKIRYLKVKGDFAFFQGTPVYEDGSDALYDCLMDMDYSLLMEKENGTWRVLADFCGTDVPPAEWWRNVRRTLPDSLPRGILPASYRELLGY